MLLQNYIVCLFLWIVLIDRTRTHDLFLISTTVRSVLLFFRWIFDLVFPPPFACVVSFFYSHRSNFLNPKQFLLVQFFTVITTGNTKQSFSTLCSFSRFPDLISLFIPLLSFLCRWDGMGLALGFFCGSPGFSCVLNSVSFIVLFVLNGLPKVVFFYLFLIVLPKKSPHELYWFPFDK